MRKRIFHTSLNLLIEPGSYQRLKMAAIFITELKLIIK
jgi:hypothetical protein